jgi:heme exporter protein D
MDWDTFFDMGGRGFYVWGSYIVTAAVMIGELLLLRHRKRTIEHKSGQ